jgi:hypothetical protein
MINSRHDHYKGGPMKAKAYKEKRSCDKCFVPTNLYIDLRRCTLADPDPAVSLAVLRGYDDVCSRCCTLLNRIARESLPRRRAKRGELQR